MSLSAYMHVLYECTNECICMNYYTSGNVKINVCVQMHVFVCLYVHLWFSIIVVPRVLVLNKSSSSIEFAQMKLPALPRAFQPNPLEITSSHQ